MKTHAVMRLLILLCLGRALGVSSVSDGSFGRKKYPKHSVHENDENMIRRIEEEMMSLNKSGELPRDKRALGILLQGFMEALGYTVSPIQLGSLPNPTAAALMPAMGMMPAPPTTGMGPLPAAIGMLPPPLATGMQPPPFAVGNQPAPPFAVGNQPAPPFAIGNQPAPPMGVPPLMANVPAASVTTPRQRETIRFTGVLNFGNNVNTTNLVNHLSQYEQLFHGNRTAAPPPAPTAPPPAPKPPMPPMIDIDPRSLSPLPEPMFVKIPLPIVPNLPPLPPSTMPMNNDYLENNNDNEEEYSKDHGGEYGKDHGDEYSKDHGEEYRDDKDDFRHHGNLENEENAHQYNETYENNHEKYDQPEDRNYEHRGTEDSIETNRHHEEYDEEEPETLNAPVTTIDPREKSTEKEYKKNENIVNYSVESKEIHDPSEVAEDSPLVGSKFNHAMYVGEQNWKKEQEDNLYRLAAEQEAKAEALAEENAEREKNKDQEHELAGENKKYHASREKEISDRNEEHAVSYEEEDEPREKSDYYEAEDRSEEPYKENYSYSRSNNEDEDEGYEQETKTSEKPLSLENLTKSPKVEITTYVEARKFEDDDKPHQYTTNYYNNDDKKTVTPVITYTTILPISQDREKIRQDDTLRDSYGQSLEKPGGKIDEHVAPYITMFKNPQTGVYDPAVIQQFASPAIASYDTSDLARGFQKIQKEYGKPESKYEEYEIKYDDYSNSDDSTPEHRKASAEASYLDKPSPTTECNCSRETKRPDEQHSEEVRSPAQTVSTSLTPPTKPSKRPVHQEPYYSTVNHLYDSLSNDQNIIARLTSYAPSTTQKLETGTEMVQNPTFSTAHKSQTYKYLPTTTQRFAAGTDPVQNPTIPTIFRQQQKTYTPTVITLPEHVTAQNIVKKSKFKDNQAWPSPYDYVYDNSEQADIVPRGSQRPTKQTPLYQGAKPDCYHQVHKITAEQNADRIKMLRDMNSKRFDKPSRLTRRPDTRPDSNFRHSRKVKTVTYPLPLPTSSTTKSPSSSTTMRVKFYPPKPTQPTTTWDSRKMPLDDERSTIRHYPSRHRALFSMQPETLTPNPGSLLRPPMRNSHPFSNYFFRRQDENIEPSNERQTSKTKSTAKKKEQGSDESSNYVEKDGMLIIPEPTPYYYNERIEEFTHEPLVNGEKVKVKEYRNRIASVKVSELKQLHPEGSSQIIQYTRHL